MRTSIQYSFKNSWTIFPLVAIRMHGKLTLMNDKLQVLHLQNKTLPVLSDHGIIKFVYLPCWLWVRRSCALLCRCRWRHCRVPSLLLLLSSLWWTSGGPGSEAWDQSPDWAVGWTVECLRSAHLSEMDKPDRKGRRGVLFCYFKLHQVIWYYSWRLHAFIRFDCNQMHKPTSTSSRLRL